ncbi:hypothetical protein ACH5RR_003034 [Cinchona calisaya]|uniref:Transmembrane protein n=1 Tax=Cinchona calisaya TaxID=153742 RepID=A0ABD3AU13_9GENT
MELRVLSLSRMECVINENESGSSDYGNLWVIQMSWHHKGHFSFDKLQCFVYIIKFMLRDLSFLMSLGFWLLTILFRIGVMLVWPNLKSLNVVNLHTSGQLSPLFHSYMHFFKTSSHFFVTFSQL